MYCSMLRRACQVSVVLFALVPSALLAITPEVRWHPTFAAAQAQSAQSAKPILVVGYAPDDEHSQNLINKILRHPQVIEHLKKFELFAANADDEATKSFCEQYKIGVVKQTDEWVTLYSAPPVLIFLDKDGSQYFRDQGYTPTTVGEAHPRDVTDLAAAAFAIRLQKVLQLIAGLRQLAVAPTAAVYAQVGHMLVELERFEEARPHLQKALQLDPANQAGAFANAYLDLTIMAIADEPERVRQQLEDYAARYPDSDRLLEARYYQGVCLIAAEKYKQAWTVLRTFRTNDRSAPEFDSPWTPLALGLLQQLEDLKLAP